MSKQLEYLYKCPKCEAEHWDSLYTPPMCVHGAVAYVTVKVYHPNDPEEVGGIRVTREREEKTIK